MVNMWCIDTPTTCLGESLQAGSLKIAQFCGVKSVLLFIIFVVDIGAVLSSNDPPEFVVASVLLSLLCIIQMVSSFLLYRGASTGNARYMKPWFWVYTIQTLLLGLAGMVGSMIFVIHFPQIPEVSAGMIIFTLLFCLICKHFCFVVLGLIYEVERGQTHGDSIRPVTLNNDDA